MFLKSGEAGGLFLAAEVPTHGTHGPTSLSPVVVWLASLDASCLHFEPPDTAPELSDCLESGTDDHKTGKNDDGGIRGR